MTVSSHIHVQVHIMTVDSPLSFIDWLGLPPVFSPFLYRKTAIIVPAMRVLVRHSKQPTDTSLSHRKDTGHTQPRLL